MSLMTRVLMVCACAWMCVSNALAQTQITADFDNSGAVDFADFSRLIDHFGQPSPGYNAALDLNGDEVVNGEDAFLFADVFTNDRTTGSLTLSTGPNGNARLRLDPTENGFLVYLEDFVRIGGYRIVLTMPDTVSVSKVEDHLNIGLLPVRKTATGAEIVGLVLGNRAMDRGGLIARIVFAKDAAGVAVQEAHVRGPRAALGNQVFLGDRNAIPTANITRASLGDVEVLPRMLDLGEVPLGTAVTRTFTIRNTSLPPASILRRLSFEISSSEAQLSAQPRVFGVLSDTTTGLSSGSTQTITVSFTPTAEGVFNGALIIRTNRLERPSLQVHVRARTPGIAQGTRVRAFADFDSSGTVDYGDFNKLIKRFGHAPDSAKFDLDKDGVIGGGDAFLLADLLGGFAGPSFDTVRVIPGVNLTSAVRVQDANAEEFTVFVRDLARFGGYRIVLSYNPDDVDVRWAQDFSGGGLMPVRRTASGAEIAGMGFGGLVEIPTDFRLAQVSVRPLKGQSNPASLVSVRSVVFRGDRGERDSVGVVRIGASGLDASPRVVDFGALRIGATAQKTLRIYNLNPTATSFQIESSNTLVSVSPRSVGNLPAGRTWDVAVTYQSSTPGPFESGLTISAIGDDPSPISVVVRAFGAQVSASPDSLNFGDVFVGQRAFQTVTVRNPDLEAFAIQAISFAGADTHFVLDPKPDLPLSVGPNGGTATLRVRFNPLVRNALRDTLKISGNGRSFAIPLSGRGLVRSAELSVAQLNFGSVTLGRDSTQQVLVRNTGNVAYVIDSLKIGQKDTSFAVVLSPGFPDTLAAGRIDTLRVRFRPDTLGVQTDTLRIFSADAAWHVPLSGTGLPVPIPDPPPVENVLVVTYGGTIQLSRNFLHFRKVPWGVSDSLKVRVENRRAVGMSFRFVATDPQIKVRPDSLQNLPPNQQWDVILTLTPKDSVQTTGEFRIASSEPGDAVTVISVKSGGSHPVLSEPVVDFGRVELGYALARTVTVQNTGRSNFILERLSLSDSAFALVSPPNLPLSVAAEGGSLSFQVRFRPGVRGAFADTLRFTASDTSFSVPLRGAGRESKVAVSPAALNFGQVRVGSTDTLNVSLSNAGADTVYIGAVAIKGSPSPFALVGSPVVPDTLAPEAVRVIRVRFAPSVAALVRDTLRVVAGLDTVRVPISGTGTVARGFVSVESLSFGSVPVGRTGLDSVVVGNVGNVPLILEPALRFGHRGFSVLDARRDTIPVNGRLALWVRFAPDSTGARTDTLRIAGVDTSFSVVLSGTGVPSLVLTRTASGVTASPQRLDFGDLSAGASGRRLVQMVNAGDTPLSFSIVSEDAALRVSPSSLQNLAAGQTWMLSVVWQPTEQSSLLTALRVEAGTVFRLPVGRRGAFVALLTDSLAFGDVRVGAVAQRVVRVRNAGQAAVVLDRLALSGTAGLSLVFAPVLPISLSEGDSLIVPVRFAPQIAGAVRDSLRLSGPDTAFVVPIAGRGIQSVVSFNPASVSFGDVVAGADSVHKVYVNNAGNGSLVLDSVRVSGAFFEMVSAPTFPATVQAQTGIDSVLVRFRPPDLGSYSGVLAFFGENRRWDVPLTGVSTTTPGQSSGLVVAFGPSVTRSDSTLSFGEIPTGSTRRLTFSVQNNRDSVLSVSVVSTDAQVGVSPTSVTGLLPGQSGQFTVSFTPVENGVLSAVLQLSSNAPADGTVRLIARKNPPPVRVTPERLAFGEVVIGARDTLVATVVNPLVLNFRVTALQFGASGAFSLVNPPAMPDTVRFGGGTRALQIAFVPTRRGAVADTLRIVGADTTLRVALSGTGLLMQAAVAPDSLHFGMLAVGADSVRSVTLSNAGDVALPIHSAAVTGEFALVDAPQVFEMLGVGEARIFRVRFAPTTGGAKQGTLALVVGRQTLTVKLAGVGLAPPRTTPGPIALDMDPAVGDQGVRERQVQGRHVTVDVAATEGALGKTGFQAVLTFDPAAIAFRGFDVVDLFASAAPIVTETPGQVSFSVAFLSTATAPRDSGSLGQARFELLGNAGPTAIALVSGQYALSSGPIPLEIGSEGARVTVSGTAEPNADFDGDGIVGFSDFLLFAPQFGRNKDHPDFDARYDLDGDGAVGFSDFLIFASQFGTRPGQPAAKPAIVE